jgi:HSP20 family protein
MLSVIPRNKTGNEIREVFQPFYPLSPVEREFEAVFNRLFGGWPLARYPHPEAYWGVDVQETEKEFVVKMEAPGFENQDFEIAVAGNVLAVKAEHTAKSVETKKLEGEFKIERRLEKNVTLPTGIDAEKITACYKNGILEFHVPRSEEAKPKKIVIK